MKGLKWFHSLTAVLVGSLVAIGAALAGATFVDFSLTAVVLSAAAVRAITGYPLCRVGRLP